jgi:hypothetical protein
MVEVGAVTGALAIGGGDVLTGLGVEQPASIRPAESTAMLMPKENFVIEVLLPPNRTRRSRACEAKAVEPTI